MGQWTEVIQTVLPVFLIIGIGIFCRARKLITREGIDTLKHVAVNICLPAVLFKSFATTAYSVADVLKMGDALNLMFLLPPPFVLPVFADDADQRVYVSSALSVSTLVAIAGFCVLAVLRGASG